jgi:CRP/FNR family transcriptional regulator
MNETFWHLKNFKFFSQIPEKDVMKIVGETLMEKYSRGESIYQRGDSTQRIYVIKKGEVLLYHHVRGKKAIFDVLGPGSIFGGLSLQKEIYTHSAEAGTNSQICHFSQKAFLNVLAAHPHVILQFVQEVSEKLKNYEERIQNGKKTAKELLFQELIHLNDVRKKGFFGMIQRPLIITHEELAIRTGMNRVTVTREMKNLQKEGKISIDKKTGAIHIM